MRKLLFVCVIALALLATATIAWATGLVAASQVITAPAFQQDVQQTATRAGPSGYYHGQQSVVSDSDYQCGADDLWLQYQVIKLTPVVTSSSVAHGSPITENVEPTVASIAQSADIQGVVYTAGLIVEIQQALA